MKNTLRINFISVGILMLSSYFVACNTSKIDGSRGPIVLGDPNTIVTETDSQYLQDLVLDLDEEPKVEVETKDNFNNVAAAKQLEEQMRKDSIAEAKQKEIAAAKPKEEPKPAPKKEIKKSKKPEPKKSLKAADKKKKSTTSSKNTTKDKKKTNRR